jgi:chemotaxis protein MotB
MRYSPFFALFLVGCGIPQARYDAVVKERDEARQHAADLQTKLDSDEAQISQLKGTLGTTQQAAADDASQKEQLEEAKKAMAEAQARTKLLNDLVSRFQKMIDAGHLKVTTRRGQIVLQLKNDVLFDKGETEVKPEGKKALAEVAQALRGVGGKRFQVAGHTDNAPITTDKKKLYPTNWELSTARAIAVVKLLIASGVDSASLSAAGFGPFDPVAPNTSPDGQAKNRRIEIVLQPHVAELMAADNSKPDATKPDTAKPDAPKK